MSKIITIALVVLSINFSTGFQEPLEQFPINPKTTMDSFKEYTINHDDYTLKLSLENTNSNLPILVIAMDLKNNARFISPLEEKELEGKFYFDFGSYVDMAMEGQLTETPTSVEKVIQTKNESTKEKIKWVTGTTVYKQPLVIKTIHDFEVFGRIQFTVEPNNTFEEIPFAITLKDGEMVFMEPKC